MTIWPAAIIALPGTGPRLEPAAPNPFVGETALSFTLPARARVELAVFDVRGARVATLLDDVLDEGRRTVSWDGRTASGSRAAAGVYLARLLTYDSVRVTKIVRSR